MELLRTRDAKPYLGLLEKESWWWRGNRKFIFKSSIGESGTWSGLDRVPLVGCLNHIISELREGTKGKTESEFNLRCSFHPSFI